MRTRVIGGAVAVLVALGACSGSDSTVLAPESADEVVAEASDTSAPDDSTPGEMRPIPTVPPSTIEGQLEVADGVIEAVPTLVPPPPEPVDPESPATSGAPPSTDLVGDPQPSPNSTDAPLPPPEEPPPPPPDACVRLGEFGVLESVAGQTGAAADPVVLSNDVCQITSGGVIVEIAFVPAATVRDDWYRRVGVEPAGDVSGDAAGFSTFTTTGGGSGAGYTIAVIGGNGGVIVSVAASSGARPIASEVAVLAREAA